MTQKMLDFHLWTRGFFEVISFMLVQNVSSKENLRSADGNKIDIFFEYQKDQESKATFRVKATRKFSGKNIGQFLSSASKFCNQHAKDEEISTNDFRIIIEVLDSSGAEKEILVNLSDMSGLENYSEFDECTIRNLSFQGNMRQGIVTDVVSALKLFLHQFYLAQREEHTQLEINIDGQRSRETFSFDSSEGFISIGPLKLTNHSHQYVPRPLTGFKPSSNKLDIIRSRSYRIRCSDARLFAAVAFIKFDEPESRNDPVLTFLPFTGNGQPVLSTGLNEDNYFQSFMHLILEKMISLGVNLQALSEEYQALSKFSYSVKFDSDMKKAKIDFDIATIFLYAEKMDRASTHDSPGIEQKRDFDQRCTDQLIIWLARKLFGLNSRKLKKLRSNQHSIDAVIKGISKSFGSVILDARDSRFKKICFDIVQAETIEKFEQNIVDLTKRFMNRRYGGQSQCDTSNKKKNTTTDFDSLESHLILKDNEESMSGQPRFSTEDTRFLASCLEERAVRKATGDTAQCVEGKDGNVQYVEAVGMVNASQNTNAFASYLGGVMSRKANSVASQGIGKLPRNAQSAFNVGMLKNASRFTIAPGNLTEEGLLKNVLLDASQGIGEAHCTVQPASTIGMLKNASQSTNAHANYLEGGILKNVHLDAHQGITKAHCTVKPASTIGMLKNASQSRNALANYLEGGILKNVHLDAPQGITKAHCTVQPASTIGMLKNASQSRKALAHYLEGGIWKNVHSDASQGIDKVHSGVQITDTVKMLKNTTLLPPNKATISPQNRSRVSKKRSPRNKSVSFGCPQKDANPIVSSSMSNILVRKANQLNPRSVLKGESHVKYTARMSTSSERVFSQLCGSAESTPCESEYLGAVLPRLGSRQSKLSGGASLAQNKSTGLRCGSLIENVKEKMKQKLKCRGNKQKYSSSLPGSNFVSDVRSSVEARPQRSIASIVGTSVNDSSITRSSPGKIRDDQSKIETIKKSPSCQFRLSFEDDFKKKSNLDCESKSFGYKRLNETHGTESNKKVRTIESQFKVKENKAAKAEGALLNTEALNTSRGGIVLPRSFDSVIPSGPEERSIPSASQPPFALTEKSRSKEPSGIAVSTQLIQCSTENAINKQSIAGTSNVETAVSRKPFVNTTRGIVFTDESTLYNESISQSSSSDSSMKSPVSGKGFCFQSPKTSDFHALCEYVINDDEDFCKLLEAQEESTRSQAEFATSEKDYDARLIPHFNKSTAFNVSLLPQPNQSPDSNASRLSSSNQSTAFNASLLPQPNQSPDSNASRLSTSSQSTAFNASLLPQPNQSPESNASILTQSNQSSESESTSKASNKKVFVSYGKNKHYSEASHITVTRSQSPSNKIRNAYKHASEIQNYPLPDTMLTNHAEETIISGNLDGSVNPSKRPKQSSATTNYIMSPKHAAVNSTPRFYPRSANNNHRPSVTAFASFQSPIKTKNDFSSFHSPYKSLSSETDFTQSWNYSSSSNLSDYSPNSFRQRNKDYDMKVLAEQRRLENLVSNNNSDRCVPRIENGQDSFPQTIQTSPVHERNSFGVVPTAFCQGNMPSRDYGTISARNNLSVNYECPQAMFEPDIGSHDDWFMDVQHEGLWEDSQNEITKEINKIELFQDELQEMPQSFDDVFASLAKFTSDNFD